MKKIISELFQRAVFVSITLLFFPTSLLAAVFGKRAFFYLWRKAAAAINEAYEVYLYNKTNKKGGNHEQ